MKFSAKAVAFHVAAMAMLLAAGMVRWHSSVFDPRLGFDEVDYLQAFARIAEGGDPYQVRRFLYPPAFAVAGAAAVEALGRVAFIGVLRGLNLLGACALIWICVAATAWRRATQLLVALAVVTLWMPIGQGLECGNVSLAVIGLTLVALRLLPRQPALAGLSLGLGLAIKPLALPVVVLLAGWRPQPGERHRPWIAAALALAVAVALSLALGPEHLPAMFARTSEQLPPGHTLSLWRLLRCVGIDLSPALMLTLVTVPLLFWGWRARLSERAFTVVATTAALAALPLVWTHTLALSLPAQVLAFERAIAEVRRVRAQGAPVVRPVLWLALLAALALSVEGSDALAVIADRPLLVQALYLLPAVLAPAIFAVYGLRGARPDLDGH